MSNKRVEEEKTSASSPDILDTIENKMGKIDRILSMLKTILKKHWGTILLILLCGFVYYIWNMPNVPNVEPQQLEQQPYYYSSADSEYYDSTYADSIITE